MLKTLIPALKRRALLDLCLGVRREVGIVGAVWGLFLP